MDDLVLGEVLALVQEVDELGEQSLALAWIDLVIVEAASSQYHLRLEDLGYGFILAVVLQIVLAGLDHRLHHVHVVHFFKHR